MVFTWSNLTLTLISQEKQADLLPKLKEKISTPEGVPRLFDLVRVQDERMKLAFYAALRNTVVAKDLDQVYFSFCNDLSHVGSFNCVTFSQIELAISMSYLHSLQSLI